VILLGIAIAELGPGRSVPEHPELVEPHPF
jgi:hypothetical protein